MAMSRIVLSLVLLLSLVGAGDAKMMKEADRLRAEAQHLCYDDVQRLCSAFIPNEEPIKACMKQKRMELSPACRKVFDAGFKTRREIRPSIASRQHRLRQAIDCLPGKTAGSMGGSDTMFAVDQRPGRNVLRGAALVGLLAALAMPVTASAAGAGNGGAGGGGGGNGGGTGAGGAGSGSGNGGAGAASGGGESAGHGTQSTGNGAASPGDKGTGSNDGPLPPSKQE